MHNDNIIINCIAVFTEKIHVLLMFISTINFCVPLTTHDNFIAIVNFHCFVFFKSYIIIHVLIYFIAIDCV